MIKLKNILFEQSFPGTVIRRGDIGNSVKLIQQKLIDLKDYDLGTTGADSKFGSSTFNAVKQFQKKSFPNNPDEWDGAVGRKTWDKLFNTVTNKQSTTVSDTNNKLISKLPNNIQHAIDSLNTKYGIKISDTHIQKELDQEKNYRLDSGSINQIALSKIKQLISAAQKQFPKLASYGIVSGYRSYEKQVDNFGKKAKHRGIDATQKANTIPGFSQHHTGKAFDIFSVDTSWWNSNTDVKKWVANNAKKYGFEVTYKTPGQLRIAEPWHLYYIG